MLNKKNHRLENIVIAIGLILVMIPLGFTIYAGYNQSRAVDKWDKLLPASITENDISTSDNDESALDKIDLSSLVESAPAGGASVALIKIPAINVTYDVIEGANWSNLTRGPIRLSSSSLIGAEGTTVISGHRTMYGAPFRNLDKVALSDAIEIFTKKAAFVYKVIGVKSVNPTDMSDVTEAGKPRLVLSTCDPVFSAKRRLLVIAELTKAEPLKKTN